MHVFLCLTSQERGDLTRQPVSLSLVNETEISKFLSLLFRPIFLKVKLPHVGRQPRGVAVFCTLLLRATLEKIGFRKTALTEHSSSHPRHEKM